MQHCDVLIIGGGPAGSSCAWKLGQAGLDVVVMDRAAFPRDKVCAGWITPQVIADLAVDLDDYRRGRTLQPITGFRTGMIGGCQETQTLYPRPVSFGIRRCEFDHYLLKRSAAHLRVGAGISRIVRDGARWVVNDTITAPMLVGAGGHFCPVARRLNPAMTGAPLVVAQETEFPIEPDRSAAWDITPEIPELYFCRDLKGYGWCFRKGQYLNIGLGRLDRSALPSATAEFVAFLQTRRKVPAGVSWRWHGHAYLVSGSCGRRVSDTGVLLAGDAAGLAYPESGEGIRPAIESGLLAAAAIVEADRHYSRERLESYDQRLRRRFGVASHSGLFSRLLPGAAARLLPLLLQVPWFVRRFLLDQWFLHASEPSLAEST
jgi:flavin-dependent dehydrogenase